MSPRKVASRKSCIELEKELADNIIDHALRKLAQNELRKKLTEEMRKINKATKKIAELREINEVLSYFGLQRLRSEVTNK